ncbi:MAG: PAS-domain containing protein, partial [Pseudomonadota bacterium]
MSHEPESRQEASRNAAVLGLERELRERLGADDDLFGLIQGDLIDAVWICEPEDPELCWISDGFWRILGLDPAESATLSPLWRDLVHPDDLATVEANFAARRRDPATPYDHMARYRRKHGGWAWIRSRGRLVEAQGDRAARLIGAHMDVTAMVEIRRRLERAESAALQSENRLRSAIEAIPDGFVLYDADDRMVLCNQRYRELYAESAHAMRPGARFEDVIRAGLAAGQYPEAAGREDAWLEERLARHRLTESSVEQQLPGERYLKIEERRTPLGDTVGFRVDITELKRQQRRLEDYAHSLEAARSEIERRACHDDLTGLATPRSLSAKASRRWARCSSIRRRFA